MAACAALCVAYDAYTQVAHKRGWLCVEQKSICLAGVHEGQAHPEFDCNDKDDKDGRNRAERGAANDPRIQARTSNAAQCARQTNEREIGTRTTAVDSRQQRRHLQATQEVQLEMKNYTTAKEETHQTTVNLTKYYVWRERLWKLHQKKERR